MSTTRKAAPKKVAVKKPARPSERNNPTKNLKASIALMGNKFWELRSKHGVDKLFANPELMWAAACEYFTWCVENPLIEVDYRGKDSDVVHIPKMRAFTIKGFALYIGTNSKYLYDFEDGLKGKTDKLSKGFAEICTRIRETIFQQKFVGSAAGFLNPNIIARDLGLVDKKEITEKEPELTDEEVEKRISELKKQLGL